MSRLIADVKIGDTFGFGNIQTLGEGTSKLMVPMFSVTAGIVIIYFLIGGFFYLKAGGNKEEIAKAREMMNHAIIGFLILMVAFFMMDYILTAFDINFSIFTQEQ